MLHTFTHLHTRTRTYDHRKRTLTNLAYSGQNETKKNLNILQATYNIKLHIFEYPPHTLYILYIYIDKFDIQNVLAANDCCCAAFCNKYVYGFAKRRMSNENMYLTVCLQNIDRYRWMGWDWIGLKWIG